MWELRLGDDIDDYCTKCKRPTNHAIVSLNDGKPAKVRCRTCYHEQDFRDGVVPPTKKELKAAELLRQMLESGGTAPPPETPPVAEEKPKPKGRKKSA